MLSNQGIITFTNTGDVEIPAGARVKLDPNTIAAGSVYGVVLAGPNEQEIGTAILYSGKNAYWPGKDVGVKLLNSPGTRTVLANGAFAVGDLLLRDVNGQVGNAASGAAGPQFGIAFEAATAEGDNVEALAEIGFTAAA